MSELINTFLKSSGFARKELVGLFGGFLLLFALNFLYKPDINMIPNWDAWGLFGQSLILLAAAYFMGKAALMVAWVWMEVAYIHIEKLFVPSQVATRWREYFQDEGDAEIDVDLNEILEHTVNNFIHDNPAISTIYSELRLIQNVTALFISFALLLLVVLLLNNSSVLPFSYGKLVVVYTALVGLSLYQRGVGMDMYATRFECAKLIAAQKHDGKGEGDK